MGFRLSLALFFAIPLCFLALPAQCRPFHDSHFRILSQISTSPSPAPEASNPAPHQNSSPVFSVLSYGAVGDGISDDTQAFKTAWDDACQSEDSPTILVPKHYTFMIQSSIFTGPCKSALVFQVMYICSILFVTSVTIYSHTHPC